MAKKVSGSKKKRTFPQDVEKRIQFLRIYPGIDLKGKNAPFDARAIFQAVDKLDFENNDRFYELGDPDRSEVAVLGVNMSSTNIRITFGKYRKTGHPEKGNRQGELSAVPLNNDEDLVEKIHVVIFPDRYVGIEKNGYGPNIDKLAEYLHAKVGNLIHPDMKIMALGNPDVMNQLAAMTSARLFRLRIRADAADALMKIDPTLSATLRKQAKVSGADEIELIWKVVGRGAQGLKGSFFRKIKRLVGSDAVIKNSTAMRLKGLTTANRVETLDLLSEFLITSGRVLKVDPRSRILNSDSMFQAIEEAFDEKKSAIRKADFLEEVPG